MMACSLRITCFRDSSRLDENLNTFWRGRQKEDSEAGRGRNNHSFQRREVASRRRDGAMDIKPSV